MGERRQGVVFKNIGDNGKKNYDSILGVYRDNGKEHGNYYSSIQEFVIGSAGIIRDGRFCVQVYSIAPWSVALELGMWPTRSVPTLEAVRRHRTRPVPSCILAWMAHGHWLNTIATRTT